MKLNGGAIVTVDEVIEVLHDVQRQQLPMNDSSDGQLN